MDSDSDVLDNWEDEAEEVTAEEVKSWQKETTYDFTGIKYEMPSHSSLLNQESQISGHYSNIKETVQPKEPGKKKEVKEKVEQVAEKIDKKLLVAQITGNEFVMSKRRMINVAMVGHVDAGKSTLCGNLMIKMKKIDPRVVEMYESEAAENGRESWWLAYIMDVIEEEREKGITIEVGKAFLETQDRIVCFLDAPGHRNYVPNMISAAAQADIAALVISARPGEFESGFTKGGQTIEHILLCRGLGVEHFIVLINKMDTINWDQDRFQSIKSTLGQYLSETCKLDPSSIHWIPVSGLLGENLIECKNSWYTGPSFLDCLNSIPVFFNTFESPLRMIIVDKSKENGTMVVGKIESGAMVKGMTVFALPEKIELEVAEILAVEDQNVVFAESGMNVRVKVKGSEEFKMGSVLCDPYDWPVVADNFVADVWIVELSQHNSLCLPGYTCIIHIGVYFSECVVEEVLSKVDKFQKKKVKTGFLKTGDYGTLRIKLKNQTCLARFDENKTFGKFVLRNEDITVALGKIMQVNC